MNKIRQLIQAKSLIAILLGLLLVALCIRLGFWQLDRAKQKRLWQESVRLHSQAKPKGLSDLQAIDIASLRYYPLQINGYFDNRFFIYWDNRFYHNQVGYRILLPLIPLEDKKAILVDLGWVPALPQRSLLPSMQPLKGLRQVKGLIELPSDKALLLQSNSNSESLKNGLRIQQIQFHTLEKELGYSLYPMIVLLKPEQLDYGLFPAQHTAYAVQWFSLAGILVICLALIILKARKEHA